VKLFGVGIDNLSLPELLGLVEERVASGEPGFIVTPNVDHLRLLSMNERLRAAYRHSWLRLADGTAVLWSARLLGTPLKEKLSGSDLIYDLCDLAARKGFSVFLLGGAPGVADQAAVNLKARYPGLTVAGTHCPPLGFENDPEADQASVQVVRESGAGLCFVALGTPKQENWCARHVSEAATPVLIGCGASVDFAAGVQRRAPRWVQRAGMEWVWRMAMEPRRLFRRYVLQDTPFMVRALWASLRRGKSDPIIQGLDEGEER
jgi:N-acetylglucosaminyldiphosphoundecaprenol N-acetyl-beta-D-mannosaminyltransferase